MVLKITNGSFSISEGGLERRNFGHGSIVLSSHVVKLNGEIVIVLGERSE